MKGPREATTTKNSKTAIVIYLNQEYIIIKALEPVGIQYIF